MKNTLKSLIPYLLVGVVSGATTFGAVKVFGDEGKDNNSDFSYFSPRSGSQFVAMSAPSSDNFIKAAKITVPAVVTIKNYQSHSAYRPSEQDLFDFFFGNPFGGNRERSRAQQPPQNLPSGMGSGVIISPEGYIVSNNHVVAGANKLEVTLSNKKSYTATLIGSDPTTDIALLKIEEKGLPYLNFGNSETTEVGQWVIAVGNPLGLNSTVTAGIISAKGRSIDILRQQTATPIESFLQTDAAINPGNSGGALVDTNGNLIGINSAISSNNGYFSGYGFAVPSNLARKVVEDIKKYGMVQRGFLGVNVLDLSNEKAVRQHNQEKRTRLKSGNGVYITGLIKNGGAENAGLRIGDIITKIDHSTIGGYADLSFIIGSKRPGDKVTVSYIRNGKTSSTSVTLRDSKGSTHYRSVADLSVTEKIGADFEPLSERFKVDYGLNSGVLVKNITPGGIFDKKGISENYIVIEVNGKSVNSQKDIEKILDGYKGNVSLKYVDEYGRITTTGFAMPN
ncbi:MAG: PDZ domain-containing protein [Bergeyella sp.]|nr:PDZ domain-containing protein [Bergeyella sp.]